MNHLFWRNIITDDRQACILRTSYDAFNKFSIDDCNSLIIEEIKDEKVISRNTITDNIKYYAATLDCEDKIHIIYTNDNINLKYIIFPQINIIVNIVSAEQNLILRCINIKILDTNPHIFFTLSDLQFNRHIICHSFLVEG